MYDIGHSRLRRAGSSGSQVTVEAHVERRAPAGDLMLVATRTCPNCAQAQKLLDQAEIPYRKVLAEDSPDLTVRYGVRQAPPLVADDGVQPVKVVGLGAIRTFAEENRAVSAV